METNVLMPSVMTRQRLTVEDYAYRTLHHLARCSQDMAFASLHLNDELHVVFVILHQPCSCGCRVGDWHLFPLPY